MILILILILTALNTVSQQLMENNTFLIFRFEKTFSTKLTLKGVLFGKFL